MRNSFAKGLSLLFVIASTFIFSQTGGKTYFDKSGKPAKESEAYYYRAQTDTVGFYRSIYVSNGAVYFEGKVLQASNEDDSKSIYTGTCTWKYKNGKNRHVRNFDEKGIESGVSKYYYESGKLWKEYDYEKGKLKGNAFIEYEEDGLMNRIFDEDFNDNSNEWDIYVSDKSSSSIVDGNLIMASTTMDGTSRYINFPMNSSSYAIEAVIGFNSLKDAKENDKIGIIYGFKDWQNYNYFVISKKNIYIGTVFEGLMSVDVDGVSCEAIKPAEKNTIKVICNGEKSYYSVNGQIQHSDNANRIFRSYFGFISSGRASLKVDRLSIKEIDSRSNKDGTPSDVNVKATGSGIIISKNGIIVTNHHVIDEAKNYIVEVNTPNGKVSYKAELLQKDKENDLAILKIKDETFVPFDAIKYSFKDGGGLEVGSSVFTIGYPYALSGMGKEAKFTDGKVSSKTGFNGAINSFQSTIPVQPGNSGGPVFNDKGQMVGVINATYREADNVSYAIKLNYINNLIDLLADTVEHPSDNSINSLSLEEKIKIITNYVVLIKVK